jgi:hypothetical protein
LGNVPAEYEYSCDTPCCGNAVEPGGEPAGAAFEATVGTPLTADASVLAVDAVTGIVPLSVNEESDLAPKGHQPNRDSAAAVQQDKATNNTLSNARAVCRIDLVPPEKFAVVRMCPPPIRADSVSPYSGRRNTVRNCPRDKR